MRLEGEGGNKPVWTKFVSSCYVVEKKIEHQGGERSLGMELNDKGRNRKDKKTAGEKRWQRRRKT
jgi:hypothetical protein